MTFLIDIMLYVVIPGLLLFLSLFLTNSMLSTRLLIENTLQFFLKNTDDAEEKKQLANISLAEKKKVKL